MCLFAICCSSNVLHFCVQDSPPDEHELDVLRLMCVKNINDDYCFVLLESALSDKSADFDVRIIGVV